MLELKSCLSSSACLECRGCCCFASEAWLPHLLEHEKEALKIIRVHGQEDDTGMLVCEFLNKNDHYCRIYAQRPFECRLYPFLLVLRPDKTIDLAAHLACPFVVTMAEGELFKAYTRYLRDFFKNPAVLDLLQAEHGTFHAYPDEELMVVQADILRQRGPEAG